MRLQTIEMKVLRRVQGVTRMDCVRNEEIQRGLQQESVVSQVTKRRERWKDKVMGTHGSLIEKTMRGQVQ